MLSIQGLETQSMLGIQSLEARQFMLGFKVQQGHMWVFMLANIKLQVLQGLPSISKSLLNNGL